MARRIILPDPDLVAEAANARTAAKSGLSLGELRALQPVIHEYKEAPNGPDQRRDKTDHLGRNGVHVLTAQERIAMELKENEALRMITAGATYDQVSQALGYENRSGAWKAVRRALKRIPKVDADDYRQIQNSRLDMMFRTLLLQALGAPPSPQNPEGIPPSLEAMDRLLKVEEFRAKLLGTLAPKEFQLGQRREKPLEAYDYDAGIAALASGPVEDLPASSEA